MQFGSNTAQIGGSLSVSSGSDIEITIKLKDPEKNNHHKENPSVERVDLITGKVSGLGLDPNNDRNPSTHVLNRFYQDNWSEKDEYKTMTYNLKNVTDNLYLRARGTRSPRGEPLDRSMVLLQPDFHSSSISQFSNRFDEISQPDK